MTQPPRSIAIQSWCFRRFKPLPLFIEQLKSAGVAATELCGVHASFADPASAAGIVQQLNQANVQVLAIGVEQMTGDDSADRPRFQWCKNAGVRQMSITFKPELMDDNFKRLRAVERLAEEFDLTLGIHNHGGYDWLGNASMLRYVFDHTSPRVGLHLDTAWAIDATQDPIKLVEQFADRLVGVHVKDFIYDRNRHESDVVVGTGILDLPGFVAALDAAHYAGPLVIEYEADEDNPAPALRQCVEALRKLY
jgi:sugar phosphate isomerase/epimerase